VYDVEAMSTSVLLTPAMGAISATHILMLNARTNRWPIYDRFERIFVVQLTVEVLSTQAGCGMLVSEGFYQVFQYQCLEEDASHFEVIDCNGAVPVFLCEELGLDIFWPFYAPYRWW
jgi:hypothetical protein